MLNYEQRTKENELLMNTSFYILAKLIFGNGENNQAMIDNFEKLFQSIVTKIEIFPQTQNAGHIGGGRRGGCLKYVSGNLGIELFGFENASFEKTAEIQHTATHEFCHAFVDILSRIKAKYPYGNICNGIKTENFFGAIRKSDENGNLISEYGIMFNETMMDIISSMATNTFMLTNNYDINDILYSKQSCWGNASSAYSFLTTVTRLTIAAFSNYGDIDYDKIVQSGQGIFDVKVKMSDGSVRYANDFLYGIVFDPMHIEEEYDSIMGAGKYQELCETFDKLFKRVRNNRNLSVQSVQKDISSTIKVIMKTLPEFLNKKMAAFQRDGKLTMEEANAITINFNKIWNSMLQEYEVLFDNGEFSEMMTEYANFYRV